MRLRNGLFWSLIFAWLVVAAGVNIPGGAGRAIGAWFTGAGVLSVDVHHQQEETESLSDVEYGPELVRPSRDLGCADARGSGHSLPAVLCLWPVHLYFYTSDARDQCRSACVHICNLVVSSICYSMTPNGELGIGC